MKYYSIKRESPEVNLEEAIVRSLAPDGSLYMPRRIDVLPDSFFEKLPDFSFKEIACEVAFKLFGEDMEAGALEKIVEDTLCFDVPLKKVCKGVYSLELFHGPTLAFKDVGARFLARMLSFFVSGRSGQELNVLVATSGDTGSAVANGFLGVDGINVYVLYPQNKVSPIQELQFTTLGRNITALEIEGTFDDCQALVKEAFSDSDLNERLLLTSANSINIARFLPQSFYYFYAYAQFRKAGGIVSPVFSVPSGNFGNLTAGLFAKKMGLPVKRFIAANNRNDVFLEYLQSGVFKPRPSIETIANAMDVGNPSNFPRILDLYGGAYDKIRRDIEGFRYDDGQIRSSMRECYESNDYVLDPHGACAYQALKEGLKEGEEGIFLETAHPAKFFDTVSSVVGHEIGIPERLRAFLKGRKQTVRLDKSYHSFKAFLKNRVK